MMTDINQNMLHWKEMCCVGHYCVYKMWTPQNYYR